VLAGEAVRLDPRDRELAEHLGERPAARAVGAPQDRRRGLVVDVERDAVRGPRGSVRRAVRLGDVEVEDRDAQRGAKAAGDDAGCDRGEPLEGGARQAAVSVSEPLAVAGLEAEQLLAEQPGRDVIEQRALRAGVVLDLRRHRRGERRDLGKRCGDAGRRGRLAAQRLEHRRRERRVGERRGHHRRRRQPRRERRRAGARDQPPPRREILGASRRQRAQQLLGGLHRAMVTHGRPRDAGQRGDGAQRRA
jgi:hypothetical protein